jgi:TatA/E family protein of Tat protein translocase
MPFNIGPLELIIVLVIALLVIGPKRLPEMGDALGKTIREFRKASSDVSEATSLEPESRPATQQAASTPTSMPAAAAPVATETLASDPSSVADPGSTEGAPAGSGEAVPPAGPTSDDA